MAITIRPFRYWVQKALPLVYDDSLSYYELLCKVINYLNNMATDVNSLATDVETASNVVETANATISAFISTAQTSINDAITQGNTDIQSAITTANTNIQTAIDELTEYRDNYFDNIDVGEYVNDALDTMASNGTLAGIINNILSPGMYHPIVVDNISDMTSPTYLYILASTGVVYQYQGDEFVSTGFVYGGAQKHETIVSSYGFNTSNVNLNEFNYANRTFILPYATPVDSSFPGLGSISKPVVFSVLDDEEHVVQEIKTENAHYIRYGEHNSETFSEWYAIV